MVDFPSHIKLVVNNAPRRSSEGAKGASSKNGVAETGKTGLDQTQASGSVNQSADPSPPDVVNMVRMENHRAMKNQVPSREEAELALRELQNSLPQSGEYLDQIHSKLDRRVIISLLAPLVMD